MRRVRGSLVPLSETGPRRRWTVVFRPPITSRRPSPRTRFWANRAPDRRTGSHCPPPPSLRCAGDLGGRRCVTPRQTCPRPEGFGRNLRSKTRWFTGFCNSHQVSHFATFFIDARAEISVAESRFGSRLDVMTTHPVRTVSGARGRPLSVFLSLARLAPEFVVRCSGRDASLVRGSVLRPGFDNDPSAGSPTETLLRLLLPLNDKVQWTSRDVAGGEPPTSPRSEHFTGPFNR